MSQIKVGKHASDVCPLQVERTLIRRINISTAVVSTLLAHLRSETM